MLLKLSFKGCVVSYTCGTYFVSTLKNSMFRADVKFLY